MILLMAHTMLEMQHIKEQVWLDRKIIGCGDNCLKYADLINQELYGTVILFGCCGLIKRDLPFLGKLYILDSVNCLPVSLFGDVYKKYNLGLTSVRGLTVSVAVHDKKRSKTLRKGAYDVVDMESKHIMDICKRPLIIIRYGVDYLDKKMMPFPFNHHTRMLQHWLCQRKMNKTLSEIWYGGYNVEP